jgi:hypothetical protein
MYVFSYQKQKRNGWQWQSSIKHYGISHIYWGATDGKPVVLQCPRNSASEYFNYKNTFSNVLFALVYANYNFMFVNAGCRGRISDVGGFTNTKLYKKLETNS